MESKILQPLALLELLFPRWHVPLSDGLGRTEIIWLPHVKGQHATAVVQRM